MIDSNLPPGYDDEGNYSSSNFQGYENPFKGDKHYYPPPPFKKSKITFEGVRKEEEILKPNSKIKNVVESMINNENKLTGTITFDSNLIKGTINLDLQLGGQPAQNTTIGGVWEVKAETRRGNSISIYTAKPTQNINCDLKFAYDSGLPIGTKLTLTDEEFVSIGTAVYNWHSYENGEHRFIQQRDTYKGIRNNSAICNNINTSPNFKFYIAVRDVEDRFGEGDQLFIKRI